MRIKKAPSQSGFTLVELVMVIILIGVLSALGIGLFASRSAFSPLLATQQLASATLLAQQAALAGNSAGTVTVEQTSDNFLFTVGAGTGNARTFSVERAGTSLGGVALPLTLTFTKEGTISSGSNVGLTFTGDSTYQTCISSLGAVYRGGCQS
ncbi:type II secretion system protein [uncultured Marinobacter sp.]|uniref:type II secretion system protein n=1 Tax=uncultured Marinobacter sp. TaxID=187379 RepID=UPI00260003B6|nr:type II secretion system protein [uncultured Marinobacter sp.]